MSVQYDSNVLQQYADELYRQARGIVIGTALRYGVLVLVSGFLLLSVFSGTLRHFSGEAATNAAANGQGVVFFLTAIGVFAGVGVGRRKAFSLKLQAQQILCQREIELNTRSSSEKTVTGAQP